MNSAMEAIWDLYECEICSAKPGAATLCVNCYERRQAAGGRWRGSRPNVQTLPRPDAKPWEEAWEEAWSTYEDLDNGGDYVVTPRFDGVAPRDYVGRFYPTTNSASDNARLAAAAPDLARALLAALRSGLMHQRQCPVCFRHNPGPGVEHRPGCELHLALQKAGIDG